MPSSRVTALSIAAFVAATVAFAAAVPVGGTAAHQDRSITGPAAQSDTGDSDLNLTIRSSARVEFEDLDSTSAVRERVTAGTLPVREQFTVGDPFVVEIAHADLAADLGDGNATTAFLDRFGTPAANLTFEGMTGPQRYSKWIDSFPNGTRAFVDAANGTTYVVVDTDRVTVTSSDAPGPGVDRNVSQPNPEYSPGLRQYDHFSAEVTLAGGSNLTAGDERVGATRDFDVLIRTAEIRYDDEQRERVYVAPGPNQAVRGGTNVPGGLDVTVVLRGQDDPKTAESESFVRRTTATVDDTGNFSATFDLSGVPAGTVANASVRFDGRGILNREDGDPPEPSTVVVAPISGSVTVRETERNASGSYDAVTVDAALSRGGFVVLHRGSATGPVAGVSGYLSPGSHEDVPVYVGRATRSSDPLVAVVHRDADHDKWFDTPSVDRPYDTSGDAVARTDFAPASPAEPIGTPTQTATRTVTPTATDGTPTRSPTATGPVTASETPIGASATESLRSVTETTEAGSPRAATPSAGRQPSPETTTEGAGSGFGVVATLAASVILALLTVRSAARP
ncbi:DUF7282 domain-containing protein [Halosimplex sp. J119]